MPKIRSHYDNLTVARNASPRVIKAAYKALCQTYHPDKFEGGPEEAERIMKIINAAYKVLSDPVKKAKHDAWLMANETQDDDISAPASGIKKQSGAEAGQPNDASETMQSYRLLLSWPFLPLFATALVLGIFIGSGIFTDFGEEPAAYSQPNFTSEASGNSARSPSEDITAWNNSKTSESAAEESADTAENKPELAKALGSAADSRVATDQHAAIKQLNRPPEALIDPASLLERAKHDDAQARYLLAMTHFRNREYQQALFWYRKAAERDHAAAQYHLGYMYSHGDGVARDQHRALYWYQKAAEQDHADAQYQLGLIYVSEQSLKRDYYKGVYWLRRSMRQGHDKAEQLLAKLDQSPLQLSASKVPSCIIKPVMSDEELGKCVR